MIKAWHFVGKTLRDGSSIPSDGVWLEWNKPLKMCSQGLHASLHPFDALNYAPGHTLCQVIVDGEVIQDKDKLVASKRLIVKRVDFEEQLFLFSRQQALKVADKWNAPDVVVQFLKTGDKNLRDAARFAARSAAEYAARSAARSAAEYARYAAEYAARSAAGYAAESFFIQIQRDEFLQLVEKEFT